MLFVTEEFAGFDIHRHEVVKNEIAFIVILSVICHTDEALGGEIRKRIFISSGRPAFRKRSSNRTNLKTPAFQFSCGRKTVFKNEAFQKR